MKIVDEKVVFPIKQIEITDDVNLTDEMIKIELIGNKLLIYNENELNFFENQLQEYDVPYSVIEPDIVENKDDLLEMKFKSKGELVEYLSSGKIPQKTTEELEHEISVLKDTLFTLMFQDMNVGG